MKALERARRELRPVKLVRDQRRRYWLLPSFTYGSRISRSSEPKAKTTTRPLRDEGLTAAVTPLRSCVFALSA